MDKNIIKEEVQFVVTDYNFASVDDFITSLEASESCKNLLSYFEQAKVASLKVNGMTLPFDGQKVIALFNQKNGKIQFRYNFVNKTLEIASRDFNTDKELLERLLMTFTQLKAQDISSVLLSFMIHYNTGKNKLKMFNEQIHIKMTDFKHNNGFTVYIPVDLMQELGCQAAYEISKVSGSENDAHIYQITSNYEFKLIVDKANILNRLKELESIKNKINDVHNRFIKTGKEIIDLNKI